MQKQGQQAGAMYGSEHGNGRNVVAMPVNEPCAPETHVDSAMHDRLYRAATVAAALLLLAGAAAA